MGGPYESGPEMDGLHCRGAQGCRSESIMSPEGLPWQDDEKLWSGVIDQKEMGKVEC